MGQKTYARPARGARAGESAVAQAAAGPPPPAQRHVREACAHFQPRRPGELLFAAAGAAPDAHEDQLAPRAGTIAESRR